MRKTIGVLMLVFLAAPTSRLGAQTLPLTIAMAGSRSGALGVWIGNDPDPTKCFHAAGATNRVCTLDVPEGGMVRLSAPGVPSVAVPGLLSGGTGPASGCAFSTCSFTMQSAATLLATFEDFSDSVAVAVGPSGDGTGSIDLDTPICAAITARVITGSCILTYLRGSIVTVTATPGAASRISGYYYYFNAVSMVPVCKGQPRCDFVVTGLTNMLVGFSALRSLSVTPASVKQPVGGPGQTFQAIGTFSDGVSEPLGTGISAWRRTTSLYFARAFPGVVTIGGFIYAIGGRSAMALTSSQTSVEAFDPMSGTWTRRASMNVARGELGVAATGGVLYAIGGASTSTNADVATAMAVERYDPVADTWEARAPLPEPRIAPAAAALDGVVYASGGAATAEGEGLATLFAYDPSTDTWARRAPMSTARRCHALGAVDGLIYAAGSDGTIEAYDPVSDAWTPRRPAPAALGCVSGAVLNNLWYLVGTGLGSVVTYVYDPALDLWTPGAGTGDVPTNHGSGVGAVNGRVYVIGGSFRAMHLEWPSNSVTALDEYLRWSTSAPRAATIRQDGAATPVSPGTTTIRATSGGITCTDRCATFTTYGASSTVALDVPASGATGPVGAPFTIAGWAINSGSASATGVDTVHAYAHTSSGGAIFLGVATYGIARPDVGALYGSRFTNSGFSLTGGASLADGPYTICAYAHNIQADTFDAAACAAIRVGSAVSAPFISIDTPLPDASTGGSFEIGGWALDAGTRAGPGVDAVALYIFPNDGNAAPVYLGQARYGIARDDVGAAFGPSFRFSGYHFSISGLAAGPYLLGVYAHSTVTGSYTIVQTVHVTVRAATLMSIDEPLAEAIIAGPWFDVSGWTIDRAIEATGESGSGVDAVHLYAYPDPGSGQPPIFLGAAALNVDRSDLAAIYGWRYARCGYWIRLNRAALGLGPGVYDLAVHSRSAVSGVFNNVAVVRVTLQ